MGHLYLQNDGIDPTQNNLIIPNATLVLKSAKLADFANYRKLKDSLALPHDRFQKQV